MYSNSLKPFKGKLTSISSSLTNSRHDKNWPRFGDLNFSLKLSAKVLYEVLILYFLSLLDNLKTLLIKSWIPKYEKMTPQVFLFNFCLLSLLTSIAFLFLNSKNSLKVSLSIWSSGFLFSSIFSWHAAEFYGFEEFLFALLLIF